MGCSGCWVRATSYPGSLRLVREKDLPSSSSEVGRGRSRLPWYPRMDEIGGGPEEPQPRLVDGLIGSPRVNFTRSSVVCRVNFTKSSEPQTSLMGPPPAFPSHPLLFLFGLRFPSHLPSLLSRDGGTLWCVYASLSCLCVSCSLWWCSSSFSSSFSCYY